MDFSNSDLEFHHFSRVEDIVLITVKEEPPDFIEVNVKEEIVEEHKYIFVDSVLVKQEETEIRSLCTDIGEIVDSDTTSNGVQVKYPIAISNEKNTVIDTNNMKYKEILQAKSVLNDSDLVKSNCNNAVKCAIAGKKEFSSDVQDNIEDAMNAEDNVTDQIDEDAKSSCSDAKNVLTMDPNSFPENINLGIHVALEEKSSYKCNKCSKVFYKLAHLNSHIRKIHESVSKHECNTCHKTFLRSCALQIHVKASHKGIKSL